MPLTPVHALSLMFLYFKGKNRTDLLALTVSSTFVDLEPLYYILIGEPLDHRIWHGFALTLTIYPVLSALGVYIAEHYFEQKLWSAYKFFRLKPNQVKYSLLTIYLWSLFGSFSHILFDMLTHETMPYVIYPLVFGNPFYFIQVSVIANTATILLAIYSCLLWLKARNQEP